MQMIEMDQFQVPDADPAALANVQRAIARFAPILHEVARRHHPLFADLPVIPIANFAAFQLGVDGAARAAQIAESVTEEDIALLSDAAGALADDVAAAVGRFIALWSPVYDRMMTAAQSESDCAP